VAKLFAFFAERIGRITNKPAKMTTFSIYNLARNNNFDCSKAARELGFKCRPFEKTIQDTVEWLRSENKINDKSCGTKKRGPENRLKEVL
jgi:dihydroflavonol-4-reductase